MSCNFFPSPNQNIYELTETLKTTIKELYSNPYSIPGDSEMLLDDTLFNTLSCQRKKGKPETVEERLRLHRYMLIWKIALIRHWLSKRQTKRRMSF